MTQINEVDGSKLGKTVYNAFNAILQLRSYLPLAQLVGNKKWLGLPQMVEAYLHELMALEQRMPAPSIVALADVQTIFRQLLSNTQARYLQEAEFSVASDAVSYSTRLVLQGDAIVSIVGFADGVITFGGHAMGCFQIQDSSESLDDSAVKAQALAQVCGFANYLFEVYGVQPPPVHCILTSGKCFKLVSRMFGHGRVLTSVSEEMTDITGISAIIVAFVRSIENLIEFVKAEWAHRFLTFPNVEEDQLDEDDGDCDITDEDSGSE